MPQSSSYVGCRWRKEDKVALSTNVHHPDSFHISKHGKFIFENPILHIVIINHINLHTTVNFLVLMWNGTKYKCVLSNIILSQMINTLGLLERSKYEVGVQRSQEYSGNAPRYSLYLSKYLNSWGAFVSLPLHGICICTIVRNYLKVETTPKPQGKICNWVYKHLLT